jgi:hypothetical protein
MPYGILHNWLQQQVGNLRIETLRGDLENDTKPVFKPCLFDL